MEIPLGEPGDELTPDLVPLGTELGDGGVDAFVGAQTPAEQNGGMSRGSART